MQILEIRAITGPIAVAYQLHTRRRLLMQKLNTSGTTLTRTTQQNQAVTFQTQLSGCNFGLTFLGQAVTNGDKDLVQYLLGPMRHAQTKLDPNYFKAPAKMPPLLHAIIIAFEARGRADNWCCLLSQGREGPLEPSFPKATIVPHFPSSCSSESTGVVGNMGGFFLRRLEYLRQLHRNGVAKFFFCIDEEELLDTEMMVSFGANKQITHCKKQW